MRTLVIKFGGSSLADLGRVSECAARVRAIRTRGVRVVVVVSAMGGLTDALVDLGKRAVGGCGGSGGVVVREMDQLLATGEQQSAAVFAMALSAIGVPAVSLTGGQAGVRTDRSFGSAKVEDVHPGRLLGELAAGRVPVVAGFQGTCGAVDAAGRRTLAGGGWAGGRGGPGAEGGATAGEVTTLGRGGSDTTAVWVSASLDADECWICTDVAGVFTADPRIVPDARLRPWMSYEELLAMSRAGSRVVHPAAAEAAELFGVKLRVRRSGDLPVDGNGGEVGGGGGGTLVGLPAVGGGVGGGGVGGVVLGPPVGVDAHAKGSALGVGPRPVWLVGVGLGEPMKLGSALAVRLRGAGIEVLDISTELHRVACWVGADRAAEAAVIAHGMVDVDDGGVGGVGVESGRVSDSDAGAATIAAYA